MSNATSTRTTSRLARIAGAATASVLLLAACGGGGTSEEPGGTAQETEATGGGSEQAQVSIVDNAFEPAEVEVATGSTVTWENTGDSAHTVTFEDGEDSGNLESGATYDRTFDAAGDFPYVCSIHPEMSGTVTVTE